MRTASDKLKIKIFQELPISNLGTNKMKTRKEYISLIKAHADEMKYQFGLKSLFLFGSVSRNEQTEESAEDVSCRSSQTFS
jgi:hypothetical protein